MQNEMWTLLISFSLVAATIAVHYEVLRFTSQRVTHLRINPRMRIILILAAALASHLIHAVLYALVYLVLEDVGSFGTIGGERGHDLEDAFYFSITSYTTLGIGDLFPRGELRIISGIEALNGLVMVGWTASMTYIYMEKFWHIRGR